MTDESSSHSCRCECPDGLCEHVWDGEVVWEEFPGGGAIGSVTCSRCGMCQRDHDRWFGL